MQLTRRNITILTTVIAVLVFAVSGIGRFHHHNCDGSICLCHDVLRHSCHDHHHHEGGDKDDCGLHLNVFQNTQRQYVSTLPTASNDDVTYPCGILVPLFDATLKSQSDSIYGDTDTPPLVGLICHAIWHRGPPEA